MTIYSTGINNFLNRLLENIDRPENLDGQYSLEIGTTGFEIQILLSGFSRLDDSVQNLPVFFSGAVTERNLKTGPFFSGTSLAESMNTPSISIADPVVSSSSEVGLAWYTGSVDVPCQRSIADLLSDIHDVLKRDYVLVGGSGGGFAALTIGSLIPAYCSVMVWNPQIDIFEYDPYFVRTYLREILPEESVASLDLPDWKTVCARILSKAGIITQLPDLSGPNEPLKLLYLQSSGDWHLEKHALLFLETREWTPESHGVFSQGDNHIMWVAPFGIGHAVPSRDILVVALRLLLDSNRAVREAVDQCISLSEFKNYDWTRNPSLVNPENIDSSIFEISALMIPTGVRVHIARAPVDLGLRGIYANVYRVVDNRIVELSGCHNVSGSSFEAFFSEPASDVRLDLMDGFGRRFYSTRLVTTSNPSPRIFVLGSCVSRDPFQHSNDLVLVDYVARTSLVSAFSSSFRYDSECIDTSSIASNFQRRMVEIDFEKRLPSMLEDCFYDCLLLDLIDERFHVALMQNGTYATFSPESQRGGFTPATGDLVAWFSPARMRVWKRSVDRLLSLVNPHKIVVNKVYWADRLQDGSLLPNSREIMEANIILDEFYEYLLEVGVVNWIRYESAELVADPDHKWGVSPFHYPVGSQMRVLNYLMRSSS